MIFPAVVHDALAYIFNHLGKFVRAYMGMGVGEDRG
jgi:hypothetical protein